MISVDAIAVEFSGQTLFKDVSFVINEADKIALMGKNGAGKSTMMKIIAGMQKPTRGAVRYPKEVVIAYLPQHLLIDDDCTVFEETSKAFSKIFEMRDEMERLNKELETRTDYESAEYAAIIDKVTDLGEIYYSIEEINYDAEVEKTLGGLGFKRTDFTRPTSEFSGGWRMRIELAKILLQKPDLILLDEPTNHIDIESVIWLEDFLVNKAKAVLVISHDKAFIDNITNRTVEVTMGKIYDYKANYSHYLELRKERRSHQIKAFKEQQKFIEDSKRFIERFRGTYSKSNQVNARERMKDLSKSYDDHVVFKDANMTIERGEKVSFVGRNGEGKSTMIKAIMGEIDFEGEGKLGHNVEIGYFAQNQASLLDPELTVFQTVDEVAKGDIRTQIKNILGRFMFSGDSIDKKVSVLSGGELKSKDVLKEALSSFDGTLILVSHDRDFQKGLTKKVFEFKNKRVIEHFETIDDFLVRNRIENLKEIDLQR